MDAYTETAVLPGSFQIQYIKTKIVKTFFNNSSDERLRVDIEDRFSTSKFNTGRVKLMFFFLWGANYHFDTAEFSS